MKKSIGTFLLDDKVIINSKKTTNQGMGIIGDLIYKLSISDEFKLIGEKIRLCLESYNDDKSASHPTKEGFKNINNKLVEIAGEKNSKSFFTKVKNPIVVLINNTLFISPMDNYGWKEGFKKTIYPNIELDYSTATDEELGRALIEAFEKSSIIDQGNMT